MIRPVFGLRFAGTVLALLWSPPGLFGQAATVGAEFQITSATVGGGELPAVTTTPGGGFIVVWDGIGSTGDEVDASGIQARRYDASGTAIGAQFQVNTYTTDIQVDASLAVRGDGTFVVVWQNYGPGAGDDADGGIEGQLYDASGGPLGGQFQVNSYTTGFQWWPSVAATSEGGFLVVWQSFGSPGTDTEDWSIQARRFDSSGSPTGLQFQVNAYTTDSQTYPAVASMPDGRLVIVWASKWSSGTDDDKDSVQARRYDAMGSPVGTEFQVNSYTTSYQDRAAVAADPDGDFVVVWPSYKSAADPSGFSVQGQRFDSSGNATGAEFLVNSYTTGHQDLPAVATDVDGNFVVVWHSNPPGDFDVANLTIEGQRYRVTGDVGDRVWRDLDLDGLQDPGEPGIPGVAVHLFASLGELRRSTSTDSGGLYRLQAKPGDYYLQFELPRELSFTAVNRLDDDSRDSDADPVFGETDTFAIPAALAVDLDWDAGMANGIGDRVWLDEDADGFQDEGEPGVAGVVMSLYDELGGLLAVTVTDLEGRYSFQDLSPDRYVVSVTIPAGGAATIQDAADDRFDSDVDPTTGRTLPIDLGRGALETTWDAGLVLTPGLLPLVFANGFESGDAGAWSAQTP